MQLTYDIYNKAKPCRIYLSNANKRLLCCLDGIKSARLNLKFNDLSELQMEVDKYTYSQAHLKCKPTEGYDQIGAFMEIYVPEFGWFRINSEPNISAKSTNEESKTFTAYSYECNLQGDNLVSFVVNMGTVESLEMQDDNLNEYGAPKKRIKLCDTEDTKYSLLHLALSNTTTQWKVGHVDNTIAKLERSFEVDNQDIYSFLRSDVSRAFRCIFMFDSINMTVNAYDIERIGKDTNIYMSFKNLLNMLSISPISDNLYTQFRVAGGDDLSIEKVNFGSSLITNIDYFIIRSSKSVQDKYSAYKAKRETLRQEYIDAQREYSLLTDQKTNLMDRELPEDIENHWDDDIAYKLEDLKETLARYQSWLQSIIESNTNPDGSLNIPLDTIDYGLYYAYKDVIIPDLQAEIKRREDGITTPAEKTEIDDIYELYGINELKIKLGNLEATKANLVELKYDQPYSSDLFPSQATYDEHHKEYEDTIEKIGRINTLLSALNARLTDIEAQMKTSVNTISAIGKQADISHSDYGFTAAELAEIKSYYHTSDFKDENIIITDYDDLVTEVEVQKELLASANKQLEIESRPQLGWTVDSDNLFAMPRFTKLRDQLQVGDFITVDYGDGHSKFRVIELELDILNWKDSFEITFSDMTVTNGSRNDFETLLDKQLSSSKNSITKAVNNATSSVVSKITSSIIKPYLQAMNAKIEHAEINSATIKDLAGVNAEFVKVLADYIKTGELEAAVANIGKLNADSAFIKYLQTVFMSTDELSAELAKIGHLDADSAFIKFLETTMITAVQGEFQKLLVGYLKVDELKAELAKIGHLDADSAFIKYLKSLIIEAESGKFETLESKLALIDQLLAGTVSAELGHLIHLTAQNVTIDEAVIKEIIAAQILVSDLQAGDITLNNQMRILSENGMMAMNGETLQIMGTNAAGEKYVAIQLGYDAKKNPSLIIRDANGTVMLDGSGLHEGIVPDGLIKTDMISDHSITEDKLDKTNIREWTDENGNKIFDISKLYYGNDKFEVSFESIKNQINGLSTIARSIDLNGQLAFTETDGVISPNSITITATTKNWDGQLKWFVDGIELVSTFKTNDSAFVLHDGSHLSLRPYLYCDETSVTIPSTYMQSRKSIVIKAQNEDGSVFDTFTLCKITDGIDGQDTYTVMLSNETQSIGTSVDLKPLETKIYNCEVLAFKGINELTAVIDTPRIGQYSVTLPSNPPGITLSQLLPGVIEFAVSSETPIDSSGTIDLLITIGGLDTQITKSIGYSASKTGATGSDGVSATHVLLSDENHTFSANSAGQATATTITTDIMGFTGSNRIATTVGSITGLPTGVAMTVNNNGTTNTTIAITITSSLTTPSGTVNIPVTVDGITFTKKFSYTLSKAGATGASGTDAKSVSITSTSQVFKSTDGGITFSPDTIQLTPIFQGGISFNKWQYSTNGGTSWTNVTSASNGLTISSNTLTIAKSCNLFTESITAISFKCISNDSNYCDVVTVLKLYDVTDIEVGGRNLIRNSNTLIFSDYYFIGTLHTHDSTFRLNDGSHLLLKL